MSKPINHSVFYVEFPATDLAATKRFYTQAFGWSFEDYGPDYVAFEDGQLSGGFYRAESVPPSSPLVVLWAEALEESQAAVEAAGGIISKPIFAYPGGRRFHFTDPQRQRIIRVRRDVGPAAAVVACAAEWGQ